MELPAEYQVPKCERSLRIAIVYSRSPLPMRHADQMTVANLIAFLNKRGHQVDLYCFKAGGDVGSPALNWLGQHCSKVHMLEHGYLNYFKAIALALFKQLPFQVALFDSKKHAKHLASEAQNYDVVYTYYIRSAEITRRVVAPDTGASPVSFLALQLSQSLNTERIYRTSTSLITRAFYYVENQLMARYESWIWKHFHRTVLIGPADIEAINSACARHAVEPINNFVYGAHGTDLQKFQPSSTPEQAYSIVFSGVMKTPTNIEAVLWFAEQVWPLVLERHRDAEWLIVGREPARDIVRLDGSRNIRVVGAVENPADYINRAAVCINPMRAGGGMQNKLIEYLSCRKATVCTSLANEGIGAVDGRDLLVADSPVDFAKAISTLFTDSTLARRLGENARDFVLRHWSWNVHWLKLEADMLDAIDGKPPSTRRIPAAP